MISSKSQCLEPLGRPLRNHNALDFYRYLFRHSCSILEKWRTLSNRLFTHRSVFKNLRKNLDVHSMPARKIFGIRLFKEDS